MAAIYHFLSMYEVLIYIVLAIGALFAFRRLYTTWNEWRRALYSLEREFALRRMGQAISFVVLVVVMFCSELAIASFLIPNLPATFFVPTPTLDFFATPTGVISPDLATQLALTPRPQAAPGNTSGCIPDQLILTFPKPGSEVKGTIELLGTVNIPNFGFYKYEVAPLNTDTWATIAAGREPRINASLGSWDTSALTPADYQLRLIVTDNQGQTMPPCIIPVRVAPK